MPLPEPDISKHTQELSSFLDQIRNELQLQSRFLQSKELSQNELEDLILDLNIYYYQSFHQQFFPYYQAELEKEIKSLYRIARDEFTLKEDIIKNLKRAGQMFNHVKSGLNTLQKNHQLVDNLRFKALHSQEQLLLELLYLLKDSQAAITAGLDILGSWQALKKLPELTEIGQIYPFQPALSSLWKSWDADSNKFGRDFKRLMINLELSHKMLDKVSFNDEGWVESGRHCLVELQKVENNLANKKSSPSLNQWYKQHVQPQFKLYLDIFELGIKQSDRQRVQAAIRNSTKWLNSLIYLLTRVNNRLGKPEPLLLELHLLNVPLASQIDAIVALLSQTQKDLQQLIEQYATASQPDFFVFIAAADKIVNDTWPELNNLIKPDEISDPSFLNNCLARLRNQFSWLEMQINYLHSRAEEIRKMEQQYEQMLKTLDSYQELLTEMKNQLLKTLAPRNLSRQFKDLNLRVEHITLNSGDLFPADQLYLLNITEKQNEAGLVIAEEDGDIFIFRLDEIHDSIIPNVVLEEK